MPFLAPDTSTAISAAGNLSTILSQCALALQERQSCIEITPSSFPSVTNAQITSTASTYITTLRTGIAGLLSGSAGRFLKPDGTSTYADIDDVLDEAGYASGWDTDYSISNGNIWTQFHDVFGVLTNYYFFAPGITSSDISFASGSGYRAVDPYSDPLQDFWDSVLADTPTTTTSRTSLVWQVFSGSFGDDGQAEGPEKIITFDHSGRLGTAYQANIHWSSTWTNPGTFTGIDDMDVSWEFNSRSGSITTVSPSASGTGNLTLTGADAAAIDMDGDFDFHYMTQATPTTVTTEFSVNFQFTSHPDFSGRVLKVWADASSGLTNG